MIYYGERYETIDRHQEGCLSMGCAGKFIAFIELLFYAFIFFTIKNYLNAQQLLIFMVVMTFLSVMALFLFIGACVFDRFYIMPWIWTKYMIILIQIMRFIALIVELSVSVKNPAGPYPIFELLLLGYNVFSLSIILELVDDMEPYTFKRFQYLRV